MRAFRKDFIREITKNKGRFLSVFFIVLLGAAFFSGIRSAEGDMKVSADRYYDEVNYMDEHTFLYVEEPILAERLLKHNYHCACCLNAKIVHNHSTTVKSVLAKSKIRNINNDSFKYYLKEYRNFNIIQIKLCCLFNQIKWMLLG